MPSVAEPEPLPERLRRLRQERGISRSQLSRATVAYDGKGLAEVTIKFLETGRRQPEPETLEAIAHALEIPPDEFPEYRLSQLRRQLDERVVGLGEALQNATDAYVGHRQTLGRGYRATAVQAKAGDDLTVLNEAGEVVGVVQVKTLQEGWDVVLSAEPATRSAADALEQEQEEAVQRARQRREGTARTAGGQDRPRRGRRAQ